MKSNDEVRVVSRNAFSKLRLAQFILAVLLIIGFIGSASENNGIFIGLIVIGVIGLIITRILRWMHRD